MLAPDGSRKSLLNRTHDEMIMDPVYDEDLINPDEFEEIAEIYDSIRELHTKNNPAIDSALAADFD